MASLSELLPLEIKMVRGSGWDVLYKGLIEAYHYLGYCQTVGEHLRYIAFYKDRPLACIGWGAAAWKVACRDKFIGWATTHKTQNLQLIAQNTRFLILPWVKVPYEDIPRIEPIITKHIIDIYYCSRFNKTVEAPVEDALPKSTLGIRLLVHTPIFISL